MEVFELGPLFDAVQTQRVFGDSKTFVDACPKRPLAEIAEAYGSEHTKPDFDLRRFVLEHFELPSTPDVPDLPHNDAEAYIEAFWRALHREADQDDTGSTLLPLRHPYVVPGGRFREIYYWDSYFTMIGLSVCGEKALLRSMLANFTDLILRHGFIPNGNRSYYLTRSQPPFFSLMVELCARVDGEQVLLDHEEALRTEYAYWMNELREPSHLVVMPDGSRLNRYCDAHNGPRPESYAEDIELVAEYTGDRATLFRDLRSAAESGWDFSSRWFAGGDSLEFTATSRCIPVDLNCLLQHLEFLIGRIAALKGDRDEAQGWTELSRRRAAAVRRYCWNEDAGCYGDYFLDLGRAKDEPTLATVFPLFLGIATQEQADRIADLLEDRFLCHGGLVTTLIESGQQWDWPNGWAPLQWMAICGLEHYGKQRLADEVRERWTRLNIRHFENAGHFLEKYNVVDPDAGTGGGEYTVQEGFGWTNGVLIALLRGQRP